MNRLAEAVDPPPKNEKWAAQARAQFEQGEPPVGEVETQWYQCFEAGKAPAEDREAG